MGSHWWKLPNSTKVGREWVESHNFLELKAVFLAFNRYYESWKDSRHIRIKSNNTTAIAYLNNMVGDSICKVSVKYKTWDLCNENRWWITAEDIPSPHNTAAGYMSRIFNKNTEWKLSHFCFKVYYRISVHCRHRLVCLTFE